MAETEQRPNDSNMSVNGNQNKTVVPENNKDPVHIVFFFNISFNTKPDVVKKFAEKFGEIKTIYDRQDRGQYFVTYFDIRDAKRAVEQAPFQELDGREIKAYYAFKNDKSKKDPVIATVTVTVSSPEVTSDSVAAKMSEFGEIRQIRKEADNIYVVKYFDLRCVTKALENPVVDIGGVSATIEPKPGEDDGKAKDTEFLKSVSNKDKSRKEDKDHQRRDDRNGNKRNDRPPQSNHQNNYNHNQSYPNYSHNQPYYPPPYNQPVAPPPPYNYNYPPYPPPQNPYSYPPPQNPYNYPPPHQGGYGYPSGQNPYNYPPPPSSSQSSYPPHSSYPPPSQYPDPPAPSYQSEQGSRNTNINSERDSISSQDKPQQKSSYSQLLTMLQ